MLIFSLAFFGSLAKERKISYNPNYEVEEMFLIENSAISSLGRNTHYIPNAKTLLLISDLEKYDWDYDMARKVMICESGGNPNAHNFSHATKDDSWGLFQINIYGKLAEIRPPSKWLEIPENNIEYAYKIYLSEGWKAWKNCL